jgi:hypothetical protein
MHAHWYVYLFPENTPVNASARGSAFRASHEPPGRSGREPQLPGEAQADQQREAAERDQRRPKAEV